MDSVDFHRHRNRVEKNLIYLKDERKVYAKIIKALSIMFVLSAKNVPLRKDSIAECVRKH
jgi:hypothetical protein